MTTEAIQIQNFIELITDMVNELPRFQTWTQVERDITIQNIIARSKFQTLEEYEESLK